MVMLNDIVSPANRLVAAVLRGPLHRLASGGLMVLTYRGRASGTEYSIPVGYQRKGEQFVVLLSKPADKTWWKNFRSAWPATLLIRKQAIEVSGILIEATDEAFYAHIEATLRRLPWMGSQFGGIKYDKSAGLTDDQRTTLAGHVAVVVFEPAG